MAIKVGGTEVIDNSLGLKNIASVDATTAEAISAAGVGGGGTIDFTASGSLSNGDLVKLNSDGTVSVIGVGGPGPATVFESASTSNISATFDSNSNKVVIAYRDGGNSNRGTAVVGTVSGTSISFGTPVVFESGTVSWVSVTCNNSSTAVIAYRDDGNSFYGTAVAGAISGTSISFGTPVVFGSSIVQHVSTVFDSALNKIVLFYSRNNNGKARIVNVSGTSISGFTTEVTFDSSSVSGISTTYDSNSNRVVLFYRASNGYGKAIVISVSSSSLNFGSTFTFSTSSQTSLSSEASTFDSNSNQVIFAYSQLVNTTTNSYYNIATVSDLSISFSARLVQNVSWGGPRIVFNSSTNSLVVAYGGGYIEGTVSGSSISFGGFVPSPISSLTYDSNSNKVVTAYGDSANSSYGTSAVLTPTDPETVNWIGFASADAADGSTATINVLSSVNEGQSGLTINSKYYLPDSGVLTTTVVDGREIGRAIAADKIFITHGSIS